ncbi:MAG: hypothetical protein ACJ790_22955, partial [Myxococcaceae bacterium]
MSAKENPYTTLRSAAFGVTRDLVSSSEPGRPWGVILETGYPEGSFTLVALADGNASVYFSGGGGFIGGAAQPDIREAAIACVQLAGEGIPAFAPATDRRLPAPGETLIYALTDGGMLVAAAPEVELGEKRHPLWPVFHAAHAIIAGYRVIE